MEMRLFIILLAMLAAALAATGRGILADKIYVTSEDLASEEALRDLYDRWYALYRSDAGDAGDKARRFNNFKTEARAVYRLNEGNPRLNYHLNCFADLTHKEYADDFASCSSPSGPGLQDQARGGVNRRHQPSQYYPDNLPIKFDWRSVDGVLTSVKQQGLCGSCWAFAAAGALESVYFIQYMQPINISVQELVDCNTSNFGCKGGWSSKAFQYVIDNNGIDSWEQYPYVGNGSHCTRPLQKPVVYLDTYSFVEPRSQKMLMDAVTQNPVVVLLEGTNTTEFRRYAGGVFRGPCDTEARHQALLVGYGTTPNDDPDDPGVNYWVVKNSWGDKWGEKGYMRLQRGYQANGGVCGIMRHIVYPVNPYNP